MDPYAKPNEPKVGGRRPKISHRAAAVETRTRSQRQAEKQEVVAERRAIKKSARQHLHKLLSADLEEAAASVAASRAPEKGQ
jgi:galactokinase/mevalonate kinase-like predicted kinase